MNYIDKLASYLKDKFLEQEVTGPEVVVALMAMAKDGRIKESDIKQVLFIVFDNNTEGIIRSIAKANLVLDEELLTDIVNDVRKALP